jgi:hypothetical protein
MEYINKKIKQLRLALKAPVAIEGDKPLLYTSYIVFGASMLYILYRGQIATMGLAAGVAMIMYALTESNMYVALLAGAFAGLIAVHYSRQRAAEGFASPAAENEGEEAEEPEEVAAAAKPEKRKKRRIPDHGDRAEKFELGKKYTLPAEEDDEEIHLDAGTTFMNAYKSLKPDQIAAMTKDTQDLMETQKQLMGTLSTLKPLIQDGKQMMDMFQSYFGSGAAK